MESIDSPCIDVCMLDDDGICLGCRRSSDEIMNWVAMGAAGRRQVMVRLGLANEDDPESQC